MKYEVIYELAGKRKTQRYQDCRDAGMAFGWCLKDFPEAKLIECFASSGLPGYEAEMHHLPPPVQRPPVKEPHKFRAPKRNEKDGIMPFYETCLSEKPFA